MNMAARERPYETDDSNPSLSRGRARLALVIGLACRGANAAVTILGAQYQPDQMFPEYNCFWHDWQLPDLLPDQCPGRHRPRVREEHRRVGGDD